MVPNRAHFYGLALLYKKDIIQRELVFGCATMCALSDWDTKEPRISGGKPSGIVGAYIAQVACKSPVFTGDFFVARGQRSGQPRDIDLHPWALLLNSRARVTTETVA
jgi:hypothetical protein